MRRWPLGHRVVTNPEYPSPAKPVRPSGTPGTSSGPDQTTHRDNGHEHLVVALEAYLDGSLDGAGADYLCGLLHSGGPEAIAIRRRLSFTGLLGQALDQAQGKDVVRAVNERLDALGESSDFERRVVRALPPRPPADRGRRRSSWAGLMAAALVVIVIAALAPAVVARIAGQAPATNRCRISAGAANAVLEVAGHRQTTTDQDWLPAGCEVIASGTLTLRYGDGTTLMLSAGSRLTLAADGTGKQVQLRMGVLEAEVAPQPSTAPCILTTPDGEVAVVGTHFVLCASPQGTRVDLTYGTVQLTRSLDGHTLILHAGETAQIATNSDFVAHPLHSLPSTPVSAPASTAAVKEPLFPPDSLAGWHQQHGSWSNDGGIVHSSGEGGPARLMSIAAYGDLVLTCRLRIRGGERAEVQVGDYNWFVTVPAGTHDWITVRLEQRHGLLHATADEAVLTPEPGAGRGPRPGPLAFYVMTGTLEIADARIQVAP